MIKKFKKMPDIKPYHIDTELEGHIFCLDENTEIYTFKDRLKKEKIKDLLDKFNVVSYNFDKNKKEIKEAVKFFTGKQECYEIEFENGKKVVATEEHRFYNENKNEVKVKDLKKGDKLICLPFINGNIGKNKNNDLYSEKKEYK